MLVVIVILFVAEIAAEISILAIVVPSTETIPDPLPSALDTNACLVMSIPSLFPHFWYGQNLMACVDFYVALISRVPGLIFETFLFTLVAVRFIRMRMEEGISTTPLMAVFVRDGTWAFALIFGGLKVTLFFTNSLTPR